MYMYEYTMHMLQTSFTSSCDMPLLSLIWSFTSLKQIYSKYTNVHVHVYIHFLYPMAFLSLSISLGVPNGASVNTANSSCNDVWAETSCAYISRQLLIHEFYYFTHWLFLLWSNQFGHFWRLLPLPAFACLPDATE